MQDHPDHPSREGPTTLYVCVTCRTEADGTGARAGRRLHDALAARLAGEPGVAVVPVECLSVCKRPCTVGLAAPGKWTYVYGDLQADSAVPTLVDALRLYAETPDGLIPWKLRSDAIKKGVVARIPPASFPTSGEAA